MGPPERTEKYLSFLASGKPVLTPAYLTACVDALKSWQHGEHQPSSPLLEQDGSSRDNGGETGADPPWTLVAPLLREDGNVRFLAFDQHIAFYERRAGSDATEGTVVLRHRRPVNAAPEKSHGIADPLHSSPIAPTFQRPPPFQGWTVLLFAATPSIIRGLQAILVAGGCASFDVCPYRQRSEYTAASAGSAWLASWRDALSLPSHILVEAAPEASQQRSDGTARPVAAVFIPEFFRSHKNIFSLELVYCLLTSAELCAESDGSDESGHAPREDDECTEHEISRKEDRDADHHALLVATLPATAKSRSPSQTSGGGRGSNAGLNRRMPSSHAANVLEALRQRSSVVDIQFGAD